MTDHGGMDLPNLVVWLRVGIILSLAVSAESGVVLTKSGHSDTECKRLCATTTEIACVYYKYSSRKDMCYLTAKREPALRGMKKLDIRRTGKQPTNKETKKAPQRKQQASSWLSALQARLKALEDKDLGIKKMKDDMEDLRTELRSVKNSRALTHHLLRKTKEEFNENLSALDDKLETLKVEAHRVEDAVMTVGELQKTLGDRVKRIGTAQSSSALAQAMLSQSNKDMRSGVHELASAAGEAETTMTELRNAMNELQVRFAGLSTDVMEKVASMDSIVGPELRQIRTSQTDLARALSLLTQKMMVLSPRLPFIQRKLGANEGKLSVIRQKIKDFRKEIALMRNRVGMTENHLKDFVDPASTINRERRRLITQLRAEVATLQDRQRKIQVTVQEKSAESSKLYRKLADLKVTRDLLDSKVASLETEVWKLRKDAKRMIEDEMPRNKKVVLRVLSGQVAALKSLKWLRGHQMKLRKVLNEYRFKTIQNGISLKESTQRGERADQALLRLQRKLLNVYRQFLQFRAEQRKPSKNLLTLAFAQNQTMYRIRDMQRLQRRLQRSMRVYKRRIWTTEQKLNLHMQSQRVDARMLNILRQKTELLYAWVEKKLKHNNEILWSKALRRLGELRKKQKAFVHVLRSYRNSLGHTRLELTRQRKVQSKEVNATQALHQQMGKLRDELVRTIVASETHFDDYTSKFRSVVRLKQEMNKLERKLTGIDHLMHRTQRYTQGHFSELVAELQDWMRRELLRRSHDAHRQTVEVKVMRRYYDALLRRWIRAQRELWHLYAQVPTFHHQHNGSGGNGDVESLWKSGGLGHVIRHDLEDLRRQIELMRRRKMAAARAIRAHELKGIHSLLEEIKSIHTSLNHIHITSMEAIHPRLLESSGLGHEIRNDLADLKQQIELMRRRKMAAARAIRAHKLKRALSLLHEIKSLRRSLTVTNLQDIKTMLHGLESDGPSSQIRRDLETLKHEIGTLRRRKQMVARLARARELKKTHDLLQDIRNLSRSSYSVNYSDLVTTAQGHAIKKGLPTLKLEIERKKRRKGAAVRALTVKELQQAHSLLKEIRSLRESSSEDRLPGPQTVMDYQIKAYLYNLKQQIELMRREREGSDSQGHQMNRDLDNLKRQIELIKLQREDPGGQGHDMNRDLDILKHQIDLMRREREGAYSQGHQMNTDLDFLKHQIDLMKHERGEFGGQGLQMNHDLDILKHQIDLRLQKEESGGQSHQRNSDLGDLKHQIELLRREQEDSNGQGHQMKRDLDSLKQQIELLRLQRAEPRGQRHRQNGDLGSIKHQIELLRRERENKAIDSTSVELQRARALRREIRKLHRFSTQTDNKDSRPFVAQNPVFDYGQHLRQLKVDTGQTLGAKLETVLLKKHQRDRSNKERNWLARHHQARSRVEKTLLEEHQRARLNQERNMLEGRQQARADLENVLLRGQRTPSDKGDVLPERNLGLISTPEDTYEDVRQFGAESPVLRLGNDLKQLKVDSGQTLGASLEPDDIGLDDYGRLHPTLVKILLRKRQRHRSNRERNWLDRHHQARSKVEKTLLEENQRARLNQERNKLEEHQRARTDLENVLSRGQRTGSDKGSALPEGNLGLYSTPEDTFKDDQEFETANPVLRYGHDLKQLQVSTGPLLGASLEPDDMGLDGHGRLHPTVEKILLRKHQRHRSNKERNWLGRHQQARSRLEKPLLDEHQITRLNQENNMLEEHQQARTDLENILPRVQRTPSDKGNVQPVGNMKLFSTPGDTYEEAPPLEDEHPVLGHEWRQLKVDSGQTLGASSEPDDMGLDYPRRLHPTLEKILLRKHHRDLSNRERNWLDMHQQARSRSEKALLEENQRSRFNQRRNMLEGRQQARIALRNMLARGQSIRPDKGNALPKGNRRLFSTPGDTYKVGKPSSEKEDRSGFLRSTGNDMRKVYPDIDRMRRQKVASDREMQRLRLSRDRIRNPYAPSASYKYQVDPQEIEHRQMDRDILMGIQHQLRRLNGGIDWNEKKKHNKTMDSQDVGSSRKKKKKGKKDSNAKNKNMKTAETKKGEQNGPLKQDENKETGEKRRRPEEEQGPWRERENLGRRYTQAGRKRENVDRKYIQELMSNIEGRQIS